MSESWYQKNEREAGEKLRALLDKPLAPSSYMIGVIDEKTNEPEFFDPWGMLPVYGSYSSSFDDMALEVLANLSDGNRKEETLAHEMFREMLCKLSLCDYGTSPRVCFPTAELKELLPTLLDKWTQYSKLQWGEDNDN